MRLNSVFAARYAHFRVFDAVFFDVFYRRCSQICTNGYHSAFNYSVDVDR